MDKHAGWLVVVFFSMSAGLMAGENTYRVGVYENPPFVIQAEGSYSGMAIELWENVAGDLGLRYEYHNYGSIKDLVDAAVSGTVDIVVDNLAVTAERAERLHFSYPWYDSGLRIMVTNAAGRTVWERLVANGHIYTYGSLFVLFIVVAFAVTAFRRRHDDDFPKEWKDGFAASLAMVISVAKSGELPSRRPNWRRNLLVSAWMIFGMAILAYITSSIASAMTTASLHQTRSIHQVADLPGHKVGVLAGSGAETYLGSAGVLVHSYPHKEEAARAMREKAVDAFVADSAVLEYWAVHNPGHDLALVGPLFHPYKFAFAAGKRHARLMDQVSVRLIHLHDNGRIASLKAKYFGRIAGGAGDTQPPAQPATRPAAGPAPSVVVGEGGVLP